MPLPAPVVSTTRRQSCSDYIRTTSTASFGILVFGTPSSRRTGSAPRDPALSEERYSFRIFENDLVRSVDRPQVDLIRIEAYTGGRREIMVRRRDPATVWRPREVFHA